MAQPFKFKYLREVIGLFVLGAVATLIMVTILVGQRQQWFEKHFTVIAEFHEKSHGSISPGLNVRVGAAEVGTVIRTSTDKETKKLLVKLRIRETFRDWITAESTAVIVQPPIPGIGEAYIEIEPKEGTKTITDSGRLGGIEGKDILADAQSLVIETKTELTPTLKEAKELLHESHKLVSDINERRLTEDTERLIAETQKITESINRTKIIEKTAERTERMLDKAEKILDVAQRLAEKIEKGESTAGRLLADDTLAKRAESALENIETLTKDARLMVARMNEASVHFPRMAKAGAVAAEDLAVLGREMREMAPDIPALVHEMDEVLFEAGVLIEASERHWLLRKYVLSEDTGLLMPSGILDGPGGARVEKVKHDILEGTKKKKPAVQQGGKDSGDEQP